MYLENQAKVNFSILSVLQSITYHGQETKPWSGKEFKPQKYKNKNMQTSAIATYGIQKPTNRRNGHNAAKILICPLFAHEQKHTPYKSCLSEIKMKN